MKPSLFFLLLCFVEVTSSMDTTLLFEVSFSSVQLAAKERRNYFSFGMLVMLTI